MDVERSAVRPERRRRLGLVGVAFLAMFVIQLVLSVPAGATPLTGGFSPTIINGKADLNGDNQVTGRDDANAFYGDTHIIDGMLDCDAWGTQPNAGDAGDGEITEADDCVLVGYDGTPFGVTITVENGVFDVANGPLPLVFNASDPDNPDIGESDFAWSAIDGRVDSNGNETIDGDDCHFGLIGETVDTGLGDPTDGADVLGNPGANECGFVTPPNAAFNGLVDLNDDANITAADSCSNGCFFGHNVVRGEVQELECPGHADDPRPDIVGTPGPDVLRGTTGNDVICGLRGNDTLIGLAGRDLLLGGAGNDVARGGRGPDDLRGGRGSDRLLGGRGNDALRGGRGNDFLDGGRGIDLCRGGPGRDIAVRCEL